MSEWSQERKKRRRNPGRIPEESPERNHKKKKLIHSRDGGRGREGEGEGEEEDEIVDADDVWMNVTLCY